MGNADVPTRKTVQKITGGAWHDRPDSLILSARIPGGGWSIDVCRVRCEAGRRGPKRRAAQRADRGGGTTFARYVFFKME